MQRISSLNSRQNTQEVDGYHMQKNNRQQETNTILNDLLLDTFNRVVDSMGLDKIISKEQMTKVNISYLSQKNVAQYLSIIFDFILKQMETVEQELNIRKQNEQNDYERSLQKLEAEVRQHIRVEQQLKLYIDTQQQRMSELEQELKKISSELLNQKKKNDYNELITYNDTKENFATKANVSCISFLKAKIEAQAEKRKIILTKHSERVKISSLHTNAYKTETQASPRIKNKIKTSSMHVEAYKTETQPSPTAIPRATKVNKAASVHICYKSETQPSPITNNRPQPNYFKPAKQQNFIQYNKRGKEDRVLKSLLNISQ